MMCYYFDTAAEAEAALALMHSAMEPLIALGGFTVIGHNVVGKNAATGADNPQALTTRWADPKPLDGGGFGVASVRSQFTESYPLIESAAGVPAPQERALLPEAIQ